MSKLMSKNFGFALVGALIFASALSACGKSDSGATGGTGVGAVGSAAVSYVPGMAACPAPYGRIGWNPQCLDKSNFPSACSLSGGAYIGSYCRQTQTFALSGQGTAPFLVGTPVPLYPQAIPFGAGDSLHVLGGSVSLGDIPNNTSSWGPFSFSFTNGFSCNNQVASSLAVQEPSGTIHGLTSGSSFTFGSAGTTAMLMSGINSTYTANKCINVSNLQLQIVHCENSAGTTVSCQ